MRRIIYFFLPCLFAFLLGSLVTYFLLCSSLKVVRAADQEPDLIYPEGYEEEWVEVPWYKLPSHELFKYPKEVRDEYTLMMKESVAKPYLDGIASIAMQPASITIEAYIVGDGYSNLYRDTFSPTSANTALTSSIYGSVDFYTEWTIRSVHVNFNNLNVSFPSQDLVAQIGCQLMNTNRYLEGKSYFNEISVATSNSLLDTSVSGFDKIAVSNLLGVDYWFYKGTLWVGNDLNTASLSITFNNGKSASDSSASAFGTSVSGGKVSGIYTGNPLITPRIQVVFEFSLQEHVPQILNDINNSIQDVNQSIQEGNKKLDSIDQDIKNQTEQQAKQHEETKGLLGSIIQGITDLPGLIMDGLKGLFIPGDDFLNDKITKLQDQILNGLGFLGYPVVWVAKVLDMVVASDEEAGFSIAWPAIEFPALDGETYTILEAGSFDLEESLKSDSGFFDTLVDTVRLGTSIILFIYICVQGVNLVLGFFGLNESMIDLSAFVSPSAANAIEDALMSQYHADVNAEIERQDRAAYRRKVSREAAIRRKER